MNKVLLITLLNVAILNISKANISQADHDTLFVHLKHLETGWVQNSVNISNSILSKSQYTWEDWVVFFNEYYSRNNFTNDLENYMAYPMFWWFGNDVHLKLQLSHKIVFLNKINTLHNSSNLDVILKDSVVIRKELFLMLRYLSRFAYGSPSVLADSSKASIISTCENWINANPAYYKRTATVSCNTKPYRALIGFQLQTILIEYEPLTTSRIDYLSSLFSLPAKYTSLMHRHQLYVADNNLMSSIDLNYIDSILSYIPNTMTNLQILSNMDYYFCNGQDRIDIERNVSSVNTFSTIGGYNENSFPSDITPEYIDGFSVVVAHEINHTIDPDYIYKSSILTDRRSKLLQRAGSVDMQYLRSMVGATYFQNNPQEFIASISNQWFSNSELTLKLGLKRFDLNYKEPINQVLFFCELYSLGGNFTRFYTTNTAGKIIVRNISLERDNYGHINKLVVGNDTFSFVLDTAGYVLGYNKSGIISGIKNVQQERIRYYPNPANETLFIEGLSDRINVSIYDLAGNLFLNQIVYDKIDISMLPKGIYFLKIELDDNTIIKEFIKI